MTRRPRNIIFLLLTTFIGGVACAAALGEQAASGLRVAACPEIAAGSRALTATYSSNSAVNGQVAAFVAASSGLAAAANEAEQVAAKACRAIGRDIGVRAAAMQPLEGPGGEARGACSPVAAKIEQILDEGVSGNIRARVEAPRCTANARAKAQCEARCDVQLDPGQIVAQCEPAQLSGTCEGVCEGRCEGDCRGNCEGQCTARNARGECVGECKGQCGGRCDGTCHAQCRGEWRAPRCEADIRAPKADAACDASCDTYAELEARCTPARVDVQATTNAANVTKLAASLSRHLPDLLRAQYAIAGRMNENAKTLVQVGADLPDILAEAGGRALACIGSSVDAVASASVRLNVTLEASASVTGKVGASAGGKGS